MTNTYLTGNPLGSSAPKDLFDNTSNFDQATNEFVPSWVDRFGNNRRTWWGFEQDFNNFLINSGFETTHLTYIDGTPLQVDRPTQLIDRAGLIYRVKLPQTFPFVLTGVWATDQVNLVDVADASLRQALASSAGSSLVGNILNKTGAIARTLKDKVGDAVAFDDFGPVGTANDTGTMQLALNSGAKCIRAIGGRTYKFTTLNITDDDVAIIIEPGAILEAITPTAKSLNVTGQRFSLFGGGTIKGQPTFDGANARPTYGTVWLAGSDYFVCNGITFDTTPKEAIVLEDSTYAHIFGNHFIGRYPQASYDESTTTNHCAIIQNAPPAASKPRPFLNISSNIFEQYIQGCLIANYDGAANQSGVAIVANNFKDCWDHGVYMSRGLSHNITGNNFLACRRPIVSDGIGSIVVGNTLFSGSATGSNREQSISVREPSHCVIAGNTIYGFDASILVDCIETTVMNGNIIANNVIRSLGAALVTVGIRLGLGATECDDNTICGNMIQSGFLGATGAAIELSMASGFANRTRVFGNTTRRIDAGGFGMNINRHSYIEVFDNRFTFSGVAASATQTSAIIIGNSSFPIIRDNTVDYVQGGTNVTMIGVNIAAGCVLPKIWDNKFFCTSASLVAFAPTQLAVASDVLRNMADPNAAMQGTFTWPTATASFVVSNVNVNVNSKITVIPRNVGAAAVMRDQGFYILPGAQSFTIFTASGNTASASNWDYLIA